ncbi:MAG: pilus assembly protein PilE [Betaproteobacteria bacterium]|nr:pilus assembly protein PilE [Betaproteobacteria bacterium]
MSQLSNYMERYYATNLRYDQDTSTPPVKIILPVLTCTSQTTSYNFSFAPSEGSFRGMTATMSAPSPNPNQVAYELQAVPQGNQTEDTQCGTLALNQTGAQGISSTTGDVQKCWDK